MRKNSVKNTRINGEVMRALADIIRGEIKDPRIGLMTSVVAAEGFIRSKLAKMINLRNTPQIRFIMDQSIAYGVNMSKKIDEVNKDLNREEE